MLKKFSCIILDPDINVRTRLKEVLKTIALKSEIENVRNLTEILGRLEGKRYDALFVSSGVGRETVSETIRRVRGNSKAAKTVIIVTLRPADQDSTRVAEMYLEGSNGFICDPYSADEILQLIESAKEAKENKSSDKEKKLSSAGLMLNTAIGHIDAMATDRALGRDGKGFAGKELERIAGALKQIHTEVGDEYFNVLVNKFEALGPPKEIPTFMRKKAKKLIPKHPGIILSGLLTQRKLSADRLATSLGISPEEVKKLLSGLTSIDAVLAEGIARSVGETKAFWTLRQKEYDKYIEKEEQRKKGKGG